MPSLLATRAPALLLAALAAGAGAAPAPGPRRTHHALQVALDPARSHLSAQDEITPAEGAAAPAGFLLAASLRVTSASPAVEEVPLGDVAPFFGNNGAAEADRARLRRYRFKGPATGTLRVAWEGTIADAPAAQMEESARSFKETAGVIGKEGVYLAGASYWYPHLGPGLLTYSVEVKQPDSWHVVSQGTGASQGAAGAPGSARWASAEPMDEIYLVGGPLRAWRDTAGSVETLAYLHADEPALARKYLDATAQYLELYRGLIGPYPYAKFALVENFWETGYGMPSFTLLGPQVIRFPFILASSYPHEILHNWWGNGVFVDYASGNWCEGLTAYLADHLIQEQRGLGAAYRRNTLQKYRDYVKAGRDFPLTEFRSRHSAASEAVGYGRMLMGAHMLRRELGDAAFKQLLARFWREQRGKQATFADLRATAEKVAGRPLERFFTDLAARTGAPALAVAGVAVAKEGAGWVVTGRLRQTQPEAPFAARVPLVVQTAGAPVTAEVELSGKEAAFRVAAAAAPVALLVDPGFDVFRRLDARESPPTLSMIFGEPRVTAVLPSADPEEAARWRELLKGWEGPSQAFEVVSDDAAAPLPADRSVWILGAANRLAPKALAHEARLAVAADALSFDGEKLARANHSAVVVVRHPGNAEKAIGWIAADPLAALPGLGRKLPHYGKYSYLGFEGAEPANMLKGEWAASDSPLFVDLRPQAERGARPPRLALPPGKALAELPPVFSSKALSGHVAFLAAPEREGRGLGTAGLDAAADYVAAQLKAIGLEPLGEGGGWFQPVTVAMGPGGKPAAAKNVLGLLRGTKKEWAEQSVVVSAHYDHLGRGWPEARKGDEGRLHAGADDNASGVAVLLELARALAAGGRPQRSIVFAALSAEEAGLLGAKRYLEAPPAGLPAARVFADVNLDTVGRLGAGKVQVLGAGTATEWPHIFRGASFVTGVESVSVAGQAEASDQRAFIERGVPAVQIFTGPHADYHRPGDTPDKVDVPGLVRVASLVKEAVAYLGERPEPLTVTIEGKAPPRVGGAPPAAQAGRKVTFGAVPDFAFTGAGVRLGGTTPGSPAAAAGLQEGDVLTQVDGRPVGSLGDFSAVLKGLSAGQTVAVTYLRDGASHTAQVKVVER